MIKLSQILLQLPPTPKPLPTFSTYPKPLPSHFTPFHASPRPIAVFAQAKQKGGNNNNNNNDNEENQRPVFSLKWKDVLNPDPENFLAVGLTGLLAWASVQVLWQLFAISVAILVAALKYSFIAALLLFILITLL